MKVTKEPLSVEELVRAEEFWVMRAQAQAYSEDLSRLAAGKRIYTAAVTLDPCTLTPTK